MIEKNKEDDRVSTDVGKKGRRNEDNKNNSWVTV